MSNRRHRTGRVHDGVIEETLESAVNGERSMTLLDTVPDCGTRRADGRGREIRLEALTHHMLTPTCPARGANQTKLTAEKWAHLASVKWLVGTDGS